MADEITGVTIPELPEGGTLTGAEQFEMVQDGVSRRTTADEIKTLVGAVTDIQSDSLDVSIADGVATVDGIGGDFTSSVVVSNKFQCDAECIRVLYSRVNNIVTCSYYLEIGLDATFTSGGFNVSLPIPTNFSNARDAFGVITPITDPYSKLVSAITAADTATNEIGFTIELDIQGATLTFVANIQYIILP